MKSDTKQKTSFPAGLPSLPILTAASKRRRMSGGLGLQGKFV